MTATQEARVMGFNASLEQRGVFFTTPSGAVFDGLLEMQADEMEDFELGPAQAVFGRVHVLRETANRVVSPLMLQPGMKLTTDNRTLRVVRVSDHPSNICVICDCSIT